MSDTSNSKHILKTTLKTLIELSESSLTPDEIIQLFCNQKNDIDREKLMSILVTITANYPKATEHLEEAELLLQQGEPVHCLLNFAARCNKTLQEEMPVISGVPRKKDMPTSTPFPPKKPFEITPESVSEIKERLAQVALQEPKASIANTFLPPTVDLLGLGSSSNNNIIKKDLFPAMATKSFQHQPWDCNAIDNIQFPLKKLIGINPTSQENILVLELIYVLSGVKGSYIYPEKRDESSKNFSVEGSKYLLSDQIQQSLRDMIVDILPLATYYDSVKRFIDKASFSNCGQVLHAFNEALIFLMQDYYLLLSQLESEHMEGSLTLQKMHFFIRPTLNTMRTLSELVCDIVDNGYRGGEALTLLFAKINSLTGDEDSQKFVIKLTQDAAVPYMRILRLWIEKGVISDPQQEFLVEDNELIRKEEIPQHYSADYWEKRYTVRRERIPCFLEKHSDVILRTGKYLNVIRQCGKAISHIQNIELDFSVTNTSYLTAIENAYSFAAKNLLEVLLKENDLMGHLNSVKKYLLLQQGDFISQFMDACESELAKNIAHVLPMTLDNLLGLTLRISSAKHDPYKDEVHCELLTYDLVTQMTKIINNEEEYWDDFGGLDLTGIECFAFRYDVKWPISLVLNHIAISKYQMLFRQLFYLKHVERQLSMIWNENSVAKKFSPQASVLYRSAFTLSTRMMNAVLNLENYMMIEVIEPNWHIFLQNMSKVENVDEVLAFHQDFLDSCLKNCLLTDTLQLNRSIFKLCKICLNFCDFISTESPLAPSETFAEKVKRYNLEFTGLLIGFLKQINDLASENPSDRFINIVHRINFNSFYNEEAEKLCAKNAMPMTNSSADVLL